MARPIVLSNGHLHVGINNFGMVHDFYYPYVGLENHAAGYSLRHKIGVWINGQISWLDDGSWDLRFRTAEEALVGHTSARHPGLGVVLEFDDFVDAHYNVFLRNIHVVNLWAEDREIRLFLHQAFVIGDTRSNTDTAQYLPDSDAILHYNGRRAFIVSARDENGDPFDQHSIGLFGIEGHEGTFRDADDGELSGSNIEHGRVDSTIRFRAVVDGHSSKRFHYWIAAGMSSREAISCHKHVFEHGLQHYLQSTVEWWHSWLLPALEVADRLDQRHRSGFVKSVILVKSHIDHDGAVIASTDTGMLNYWRDAYAYCWPRDGAYAVWPLIRLGYKEEPQKFFDFCLRTLHPAGYLMHKFRADGALGSSWHPYVHESGAAPPIQEDETALVLFVFAQFYHRNPSESLLDTYFDKMIVPMANFLANYVDESTGLPRPTYDLWEEQYMVTTYTTSVVVGALYAAAELAELRQHSDSAVRWRTVADDIRAAMMKRLYDKETGAFLKGLVPGKDNTYSPDHTIDASGFFGVFMYGICAADGEELRSMHAVIERTLGQDRHAPGLPRYENDNYLRSDGRPPNTWLIATLWMAEYYNETNQKERAEQIFDWVRDRASATGMFAEQVDPQSNTPMSVSPLTWSHAEYVAALLDTVPTSGGQDNG